MARFYVGYELKGRERAEIEGGDVHHIRDVLRLKVGDGLILWDASGMQYRGRISAIERRRVVVEIEGELAPLPKEWINVTLAQALLKAGKMELIIQKATELGVSSIIPFTCGRTIPRLSGKVARWGRVAYEASKQCGRASIPEVGEVLTFDQLMNLPGSFDIKLLLWEEEKLGLKEVLRVYPQIKAILLVVGPEGGFAREEVEVAKERGFIPVSLGPRILRSETVPLTLMSILQFEYGDLGET